MPSPYLMRSPETMEQAAARLLAEAYQARDLEKAHRANKLARLALTHGRQLSKKNG